METIRRYYNEEFCTLANINSVIKNLSEELYVTGLPTLPDYTTQKPMDDHLNMICHLANALWAVIQMNRRTLELKRETETKLITLDSDNNSLKVKMKNLTEELTSLNGKVKLERLKNKQMELDQDVMKQQVKTLKGVVEMLRKDLHTKSQIYSREIKKSCDESVKLRQLLNNILTKRTIKKTDTRTSKNQNKNNEEIGENSRLPENVKLEDENCHVAADWKALCKNCTAENVKQSKEELYKRSICRLQNTITSLVHEAYMARQRYLHLSCDVVTLVKEHTGIYDTDDNHFQITKATHIMPSDYELIDEYTKSVLEKLKTNDCKG